MHCKGMKYVFYELNVLYELSLFIIFENPYAYSFIVKSTEYLKIKSKRGKIGTLSAKPHITFALLFHCKALQCFLLLFIVRLVHLCSTVVK